MKHVLLLTILSFFNAMLCSEETNCIEINKNPLEQFFPIEESYNNIVIINNKNHTKNAGLHDATQELLKQSQRYYSGFCYGGMLLNSPTNPKLTIISFKFPYFLTLQKYQISKSSLLTTVSKNIDPTFDPHLTKKQANLKNTEPFWRTSIYNRSLKNINENEEIRYDLISSESSFWGPFFEPNGSVGCFFYTSISNNDQKNAPYSIFYHNITTEKTKSSETKSSCKECYVSYDGLKNFRLYGNEDKYFLLLLATFFPFTEKDNKKIFFTNKYTQQELYALDLYVQSFNEDKKMPTFPAELKNHIKNKTIFTLFIDTLTKKKVTSNFYVETKEKISFLKNS